MHLKYTKFIDIYEDAIIIFFLQESFVVYAQRNFPYCELLMAIKVKSLYEDSKRDKQIRQSVL